MCTHKGTTHERKEWVSCPTWVLHACIHRRVKVNVHYYRKIHIRVQSEPDEPRSCTQGPHAPSVRQSQRPCTTHGKHTGGLQISLVLICTYTQRPSDTPAVKHSRVGAVQYAVNHKQHRSTRGAVVPEAGIVPNACITSVGETGIYAPVVHPQLRARSFLLFAQHSRTTTPLRSLKLLNAGLHILLDFGLHILYAWPCISF